MNEQFFKALSDLSAENEIDKDILIEKIKDGITKAIKREYPESEHIRVDIDPKTGKLEMCILKEVMKVMFVDDPENEIYIGEARNYDPDIKEGDWVEIPVNPTKIGRQAAQNAKQSIKHDIKDFERNKLIEQYKDKEHEIVTATVQKVEPATGNAVITIDKNEHYFYRSEQIPGEILKEGDKIKVYIVSLGGTERKQPVVKLSRTHKDLVKRLFELEVPEIADGTVEVKAISRIEGIRSKIAVWSKDNNVDAVGACIGPKKSRISAVVSELKGEKIDVINWNEDEAAFIAKALAPAEVIRVDILEPEYKTETKGDDQEIKKTIKKCRVVVPVNQFSLAIGNKGQNAKLAAGLTGYKIDIVPENSPEAQEIPKEVKAEEEKTENIAGEIIEENTEAVNDTDAEENIILDDEDDGDLFEDNGDEEKINDEEVQTEDDIESDTSESDGE